MKRNLFRRALACLCLCAVLSGGLCVPARAAGFRDVPASIAQEVNYAARQGWITGVTATAFRPDAALTANAWSAFLLRMLGYSDKAGDFTIADAAGFAQRIGLFPIAYTGTLTQGDLFEMAADALSFSYRDGSATVIGRLVSQGTVSRAAANALGLLTPALTARQVADRCAAAVFRLDTYETEAYRDEGLVTGEASGFFITEDGLAVTNYHSIADAVSATATLSTGDVYEVERVIYYDPDIDIAVIRVSHAALKGHDTSAFATLDIADSGTGDLRAGDTVYAIGNPLGELTFSMSQGIVSCCDRAINVDGTAHLAAACKAQDCKMMYISTDYVFNGQGQTPWQPDCKDYQPLNYYGETKLGGELAVSSRLEKYFIVRIAWVFGLNGKNFIKTMLQLGKTHDKLRVVCDQIGTPTYTLDLARLLVDMIESDKYGYYHATNEGGYISWYDFACEIFRQAGLPVQVDAVTTAEDGASKAARPFNSRLDKSKLAENGFTPLPEWKDALSRYLRELGDNQ